MSDDLFNAVRDQVQIDPEKDYHSELVGEGKSYRDEKALARAVVEKEAMIKRLQAEMSGVRNLLVEKDQEIQSRVRLEELADKLAVREPPASPSNDAPRREPEVREVPSPVDLDRLLDERLRAHDKAKDEAANLRAVQSRLVQVYGPDYSAKLREHAEKLGIGPEFMNETAKRSPAAFFSLIGIQDEDVPRNSNFGAPPQSTINSDAIVHRTQGAKTMKYYKEMAKKDPKSFYTPRVQMELHNNALKMGADFFDA